MKHQYIPADKIVFEIYKQASSQNKNQVSPEISFILMLRMPTKH